MRQSKHCVDVQRWVCGEEDNKREMDLIDRRTPAIVYDGRRL